MANWITLQPNQLFPEDLRKASDAVGEVVGTISDYLNIVRQALGVASQLSNVAPVNSVEGALNAGLDQLQALINGVVSGSTVHAIAIPIQKQYYGRGVRAAVRDRLREMIPSYDNMLDSGAFRDRDPTTLPPSVGQFINTSVTAVGGNQGFWRELMLSLQDPGDVQRPLFPSNFAVAGAVILAGATDLETLQPNFSLINSLINAGERADLAAHTRPVLRGLRGRVVGFTNSQGVTVSTGGRLVIELSWESVPPTTIFPLFSDERFTAVEIFVIRSTEPTLRQQFAWGDLFSRMPEDSPSDLQSENGATVVARLANDGFLRGYTDSDSALEPGKVYYYTTAVRYKIGGTMQPMSNFSNCVRVALNSAIQTRASVPPDWVAYPTLAELFPPISEATTLLNTVISNLRSRTVSRSGLATMLSNTATQLGNIADQLALIVRDIQSVNTRIGALTNTAHAAISATVATVPTGGIDAFTAEIARRLSDTSDSSRPPFDNAELVAGVVVVAGAPNEAQLAATITLLETLFGSSAASPLLQAIGSVEAAAAGTSNVSFGTDMGASRGAVSPASTGPTGFDSAMKPSSEPQC